jgi:hypothetical protein
VFFTAGFSTKEPILIAISLSESGGWFTLVGVLSVSFTLVYSMRILRSLAGVTSNRICRHLSNIPLAISLMLGVLSSIVIWRWPLSPRLTAREDAMWLVNGAVLWGMVVGLSYDLSRPTIKGIAITEFNSLNSIFYKESPEIAMNTSMFSFKG